MHVAPLALGLLVSSACTAGYGMSTGRPATPPPIRTAAPATSSAGPSYGPGEDRHWFADDDYLVSRSKSGETLDTHVAKLLTPPADATRHEAQFLMFDGRELWTSTYFLTRVAAPAELAVGVRAFCHWPSTYRSGVPGPRDKRDARVNRWVVAPITDTAELYKGRVAVGRHSCPVEAIRVAR